MRRLALDVQKFRKFCYLHPFLTPSGPTVTVREQLLTVYRGGHPPRIPNVEFGYWALTLTTWHAQGLPGDVTSDAAAERHFGLEGLTLFEELPVRNSLFPAFERTVLADQGDRQIIRDDEGNTCEVFPDTSSIDSSAASAWA